MAEVRQAKDDIVLDPEMEYFISHKETENDWVQFKENVRPLKRGRNVELLNKSLRSHTETKLKSSLLQTRRELVEAIGDYQGDDPLQPWLQCISWVQESFPAGGDPSGLILLYEQCVRSFWHSEKYQDDVRYLKVWLEYAENCKDAEVIFKFLEANNIGKSHAILYVAYATHMESKSKMKSANELFNLGISRKAQPLEKLQDAFKRFLARSLRRGPSAEEETADTQMPSRCFGTVLSDAENRMKGSENCNKRTSERNKRAPIAIFKDSKKLRILSENQIESKSWKTLPSVSERNKENNDVPSKWTDHKVPISRGIGIDSAAPSPSIDVFVDDECAQVAKLDDDKGKQKLKLRKKDKRDMKEAENLKENPLRNFPASSLPR